MYTQQISCCIVGADRIVSNGDTANKIGTYSIAVCEKQYPILRRSTGIDNRFPDLLRKSDTD